MSSYLFAWLAFLGLALGSMANLMLHNLTGGPWGAAVRAPLAAATKLVPLAALLGIPMLVGMRSLYPIEESGWFAPWFFASRSIAYLAIWTLLSMLIKNNKPLSAAGLIVYVFTVSLAAVDWIASLVPEWRSSGFGLVVATGQMLGAMALATAFAGLRGRAKPEQLHDLGNLLLMYAMGWAYLAYTQFLIIWAEDLPHEISWYLPRLETGWRWLGLALAAFQFAVPFAILLSRSVKRSPALLGGVALAMLLAHVADVYWLVAPSLRPAGFSIAWGDPLALAAAALLWFFAWRPSRA
jgi:hypothetical protein